jgi:hypothetical protein
VLAVSALYEVGMLGCAPLEPMFPARLFKNSTAIMTLVCSIFHGGLLYSDIFYMPLIYQAVFLEKSIDSAVSILPLLFTSVGVGAIARLAVDYTRKYRWIIIARWAVSALGCGLVATWDQNSSRALVSGIQVLIGIGVGPLLPVLVLPIQASLVNIDDGGLAPGMVVCFRWLGGLISLAMCSTLFSHVFLARISSLGTLPRSVALLADLKEAIGVIRSYPC